MRSWPVICAAPQLEKLGLSEEQQATYFDLRAVLPRPRAELDAEIDPLMELGLLKVNQDRVELVDPIHFAQIYLGLRRRRLKKVRSPYQLIELHRLGDDYFLALNGAVQFHSQELRQSHELMVGLPLCLAREARSVLILGGGDGYAAAEALRFPSVERVRVVELDPEMVKLSRTDAQVRRLNEDAFHHPKVEVLVGDAIGHLLGTDESFDVIVDDCEFSITGQPDDSRRRYVEYLKTLPLKLAPGGVGSFMSPLDPQSVEEVGKILVELGQAGQGSLRELLEGLTRAFAPHYAFSELRSFYLDAEVYSYFSDTEIGPARREPPPGNLVLDQALSGF